MVEMSSRAFYPCKVVSSENTMLILSQWHLLSKKAALTQGWGVAEDAKLLMWLQKDEANLNNPQKDYWDQLSVNDLLRSLIHMILQI